MPTYTFTRTREQLRDLVLRKLGALGAGETANSDDAAIVYEALDLRIKELHAKNKLWFKVSGAQTSVALTSGVATVAAASDVLYPETFSLRINGEDTPLEIIGNTQYQQIPNKADQGQPERVMFAGGVYYFHPVPNAAYTGKLTYQQIGADTAAATAPDVQASMLRSLRSLLAYDLADDFGIPENRIVRMKLEADDAMRTILALNQQRVDNEPVQTEYF